MVHTFELSKMIPKDTYEKIISLLHMRWFRGCFITNAYVEKGFPCIRLYKFKNKMYKAYDDDALMHLYMVALSINTAKMFSGNGDPHLSQSILNFIPDYVKAIYRNIFELIPCLEQQPEWCFDSCWDEAGRRNVADDEDWLNEKKRLNSLWLEVNAFKARRIDFAYDLKYMHRQYLMLIDRGYSLRKGTYKRSYFEDEAIQDASPDDEPDIPDSEELLRQLADEEKGMMDGEETSDSDYSSDVNYVYYKGKGVNVNIYHKATEIQKEKLTSDPYADYDFLRIEVQVKKSKLNSIVAKFGLNKGELHGRELQYLMSPEVEEYVLKSYVKSLTGT
ncbi:MAG: hypothetical protein NC548_63875, partial [Lachnospiraceae bacterium]|nr:hypothetical protein [Lachnospiraceae bacterium]